MRCKALDLLSKFVFGFGAQKCVPWALEAKKGAKCGSAGATALCSPANTINFLTCMKGVPPYFGCFFRFCCLDTNASNFATVRNFLKLQAFERGDLGLQNALKSFSRDVLAAEL